MCRRMTLSERSSNLFGICASARNKPGPLAEAIRLSDPTTIPRHDSTLAECLESRKAFRGRIGRRCDIDVHLPRFPGMRRTQRSTLRRASAARGSRLASYQHGVDAVTTTGIGKRASGCGAMRSNTSSGGLSASAGTMRPLRLRVPISLSCRRRESSAGLGTLHV